MLRRQDVANQELIHLNRGVKAHSDELPLLPPFDGSAKREVQGDHEAKKDKYADPLHHCRLVHLVKHLVALARERRVLARRKKLVHLF